MWPSFTNTWDFKNTDIKYDYIRNFVTRYTYIKDVYNTDIYIKSICNNNIYAIKCFRIYLQSFQNLEVGGIRLKI